jgi:DNA-binding transcriptional ArsR family regulator
MMNDGPSIARIAAAIGDHARAEVLTALLADRALTASELANLAGVTKQTMSAHLGKLLDVGLVAVANQGRHRYFRLANRDVAALLESLMGVAFRTGAVRFRSSPREPALRKARICYDHLAGELGVLAYEELLRQRLLHHEADCIHVSSLGRDWFRRLDIDVDKVAAQRRAFCRPCLDWSERRMHMAGSLGSAFLERIEKLGWARRMPRSRVVAFSPAGERSFHALLQG